MTQNNVPTPMYILARLNVNGQCISVAKEYEDVKVGVDTTPFKVALEKKKASGKAIKAAMTFPGGTHDLWIRYWLAAGGSIRQGHRVNRRSAAANGREHESRDHGLLLRLRAVEPAAHSPEHRLYGDHHRRAVEQASREVVRHACFLVDKYPKATTALLKSVLEAQQWCDVPANRDEVAAICAKRQWINCPVDDVTDRVKGKFDYGIPGKVVENSPHIMRYWSEHASYPFQSHDLWFLTEDIRWGKFEAGYETKGLIAKVNREDLWRDAAKALNVPAADIPASRSRGKETFFDGKIFDLYYPAAYLRA